MPESIFSLLDPRSFSSLWYWIMVGLIWTNVMNRPLGVPLDMIRDAQAGDDQAASDVHALTDMSIRRRNQMLASLGYWRAAVWSFSLTVLALLAIRYRLELAQAILLVAAPLGLTAYLTDRASARITRETSTGQDLYKRLLRLKLFIQVVAFSSVFFTAVWGMLHTLSTRMF